MSTVIDPSKATFTWQDPTTNVDDSPIVAGEVSGYTVGIRSATATGSVAGAYPIQAPVADPAATSEAVAAIGTVLKPDDYAAAIQTAGPKVSDWSPEITFTIAAPVPPVPNPPGNFSIA